MTDLYYGIQGRNKRRYSPEFVLNALENFKENHKIVGDDSHPISGGESIEYAQSCVMTFNISPRFEVNDDGSMKLTSFGLVKEE